MGKATVTLEHPNATVRIEELGGERRRVSVEGKGDAFVPYPAWETAYPLDLIKLTLKYKGAWVLDEIKRDEDPLYVGHEIKWEVLSYLDPARLDGCDLLDFGCGCGASSLVISRLAPTARITGIELEPGFLEIARRRAEHFGVSDRVRFRLSPSSERLPDRLPPFDYIFLSAVYEHLLPAEREALLPTLWSRLKPGGVLFLNQTPHRWFPVEHHTTRLPFINYLPDGITGAVARRLSNRLRGDETWDELLRKGIRGSTAESIVSLLNSDGRKATSLRPSRYGATDHFSLWYHYSNTLQPSALRRVAEAGFRMFYKATGLTVLPYISLAIEKRA